MDQILYFKIGLMNILTKTFKIILYLFVFTCVYFTTFKNLPTPYIMFTRFNGLPMIYALTETLLLMFNGHRGQDEPEGAS